MGALLALLLAALLTLLPCAGQAKAADGSGHPATPRATVGSVTVVSVVSVQVATGDTSYSGRAAKVTKSARPSEHHRTATEEQGHWILCTADGQPPRNNGCTSHPYCPQDAQLPNPPPQPQPAVSPLTPAAPEALPRVVPAGLLDGAHPVPDLHELQVHRS
ncbi:hypothetical protein ABZW03_30645 [Kitasatospora sp. NPDC004799]|uniref:hypothetical protein n=1 Tax=Kitasatospora sp. NPDC004799 TaxID=3154460 RepID=UPI0033ADDCD9